jgi:hypothetical protein
MNISFLDFWDGFDINNNFFTHSLNKVIDVIVTSPDESDLIIFSCFGHSNFRYMNKKRIFFTGENLRPNFDSIQPVQQGNFLVGKSDFAFTFDFSDDVRNYRLPLWMLQIDWFGRVNYTNPQYTIGIDKLSDNPLHNKNKDKFCSIVFNSNSPFRYEMINTLSKFKKVDCFGKPFGNWFYGEDIKMSTISEYKFNICFENSIHSGYHTEKLIHAKSAGCIPIYWADDKVGQDFNIKSFVNLYDFKNNIKDLVDYIIEIDQNNDIYLKIKNEPLFTPTQDPKNKFNLFLSDLKNILNKI